MRGTMRIAVSGHQARPGIDWTWTGAAIRQAFERHAPVERAFTSLAAGSDQVFARQALALGIPVTAVLPFPDYARCFQGSGLAAYEDLLRRCSVVTLPAGASDEHGFLEAGRQVADRADLLVAVWDGHPAAGPGGTADIVRYCVDAGRAVLHIDPLGRSVRSLGPA
jgi:hypothetical protein